MTPPFLKSGDTIAIVATARWIDEATLQPAIALLESWGLRVVVAGNVHIRHYQLAGHDMLRAQSLQEMLDREDVQAILVARGGYGTIRLIDHLRLDGLLKFPKWICGFSDVTVLHNAFNNLGIATIHGPMPFTFAEAEKASLLSLKNCLFGEDEVISLTGQNVKPISNTQIVGGNLSVIASQLGSATQPDARGKLLFLEDIDEMLYHIDRMLIALKRAGIFEQCAGIIQGGFTTMRDNTKAFGFAQDNPWSQDPSDMIQSIAKEYKLPLLQGLSAGHITDNRAFYMGRNCELIAAESGAEIRFAK